MPARSLFASVASAWVVAAFLCGCGGTPPPAAVPPSAVVRRSGAVLPPSAEREPPSPVPPPEWLPLGELRVNVHGEPWLVLYRNGLLADRGTPVGTLRPDGRFLDLDGIAKVTVTPDGRIELEGGWVAVAEDGTMAMELHGFKQEGPGLDELGARRGIEVVGLRPELRRTAMLVMLIADLVRLRGERLVE